MDKASNHPSRMIRSATCKINSPLATFSSGVRSRESLVMDTAQLVIFKDVSMSWPLGHQKPRWAHLRRYQMRLVSSH